MRVPVKPEGSYHLINHGPCNLISTGDGQRRNIAPINWTMPLSDDPALLLTVIETGIYTERLLKETKQFVVNVVSENLADKVLACGREHGDQADKFQRHSLTPLPSVKVKAPRLGESAAHLECELVNDHPYEGVTIYVGRVLYAEVEQEFWDGQLVRADKLKSIHHLGRGVFAVSDRVIKVKKI